MNRFVFTFGTLYEPKIVTALLGKEPQSFLVTIKGYQVYRGTAKQLSPEIYQDLASKRDMSSFSYLFAKKSADENASISGKVYEITLNQELILDWWERYPRWYRKEEIKIVDLSNVQHDAYLYVIDKEGEKLEKYERVQGDLESYLLGAAKLRTKIHEEFPEVA